MCKSFYCSPKTGLSETKGELRNTLISDLKKAVSCALVLFLVRHILQQ